MTRGQSGLSLVELMVAMVLISIVALSSMKSFYFISRQSVANKAKSFTAQKCVQMLEELRGGVVGFDSKIGLLDDYDDGGVPNYILSARKDVTSAADPVSGNADRRFYRLIDVQPLQRDEQARQVWVRVYDAETKEVLAESFTILRTLSNRNVPTQVFDLFIVALENVPGWWVTLSEIKPMFDSILQDIQSRNPGLEIRPHWITRMSYGRDPFYAPYINEAVKSDDIAIANDMKVYYYPGWVAGSANTNARYYVADAIQGRVRVDNETAIRNAGSYALADRYNHAVRYPEEEAMYAATYAATPPGTKPPEISYRMLLERLHSSPGVPLPPEPLYDYRNALVVNLHGEILPLPPVRNYSDAARDPALPNVRVVTHPEQLQYTAGDAVQLRVYSYVTNPDDWGDTAKLDPDKPIQVLISTDIPPAHFTNAPGRNIRHLRGDAVVNYAWEDAGDAPAQSEARSTANGTLVTLKQSELRHGRNGPEGVFNDPVQSRLYYREYVPCLARAASSFDYNQGDLKENGNKFKNTARWTVTLPPLSPGMYTITTWIGDTLVPPGWPNLSRTYVWVGVSAPVTERYQFLGDPRHMPYADVKVGGGGEGPGFNRYFIDVKNSDIPGFNVDQQGWDSMVGFANIDVPRYFQILREGLMKSEAVFNIITGYSAFYVGLGGEMGDDGSIGFANGLRIVETPWRPASRLVAGVNEIIDDDTFTHSSSRLISDTRNGWYGLYWLGELYPDHRHGSWSNALDPNHGNLPVGGGASADVFYRDLFTGVTAAGIPKIPPSEKPIYFKPSQRTARRGIASLFNGNSGSGYVSHELDNSNQAALTDTGRALAQDFNFPLLPSMGAMRPFKTDHGDSSRKPPEWNAEPFDTSSLRADARTLETYYDATDPSYDSSAAVRLSAGAGAATMVLNGLSTQASFGSSQIGKMSLVTLLRGFMAAGAPGVADPVSPLPLVEISSPSVSSREYANPSNILITWELLWRRWDRRPYTGAYPANYTGISPISYNLKYSANGGKTWRFVNAPGLAAERGVYDPAQALASLSHFWDVSNPAAFPAGNYLVRVEAYRADRGLHFTYHQRPVIIRR